MGVEYDFQCMTYDVSEDYIRSLPESSEAAGSQSGAGRDNNPQHLQHPHSERVGRQ